MPFFLLIQIKTLYLWYESNEERTIIYGTLGKRRSCLGFWLHFFETKDKKGYDKVIGYKAWNIAYDLIKKGLIKVNPENPSSWVKN